MSKKLDIFRTLRAINDYDLDFLQNLKEDERKAFSPVVVAQWLRGADVNETYRIQMMNMLVNKHLFSLGGKHPDLIYKMMCVSCGFGDDARYQYIKKGKQTKHPKTVKLLMSIYCCNDEHAHDMLVLLDKESVQDLAEEVGMEDKDIKDLLKEWK